MEMLSGYLEIQAVNHNILKPTTYITDFCILALGDKTTGQLSETVYISCCYKLFYKDLTVSLISMVDKLCRKVSWNFFVWESCDQSCCKWPILSELRLSVRAWIRTCKAGLVQVLIGFVKHSRYSASEMSLTPIIPQCSYRPMSRLSIHTSVQEEQNPSVTVITPWSLSCIVEEMDSETRLLLEDKLPLH